VANSALQRKNMVESQVRPSDVTDRRITGAMQEIQRERFLPANLAILAYIDDDLNLEGGRSLMAPRVFARLLQLAEIEPDAKILIVGTLCGYSAAVASRLAAHVVALEVDKTLVSTAKTALLLEKHTNVTVVAGPLHDGWAAEAPYDVILVEGAIEWVPEKLTDQLAPGGRLVAIEVTGKVGHAISMQKVSGGQGSLSRRVAFDVSASLLPGFSKPKAFAF
jgi:protein-L-isoaspartate(D-aspartate) O-methyltransferase